MLNWIAHIDGFKFEICTSTGLLAVKFWSDVDQNPASARIPLLLELLQNGQAQTDGISITVPHTEIIRLDNDEQHMLGLPSSYPYSLLIRSQGVASDPEFRLFGEYYRFLPGGEQLYFNRIGCLIQTTEQAFLLNESQFNLMESLTLPIDISDELAVYKKIQTVQQFVLQAQANLESYLADEQILIPEQFGIELSWNHDQSVSVLPSLPHISNFTERFEKSRRIRRMYNLELDDGQHVRVVLPAEQQQALESLQSLQRLQGEDRENFLAHPETVLDPDLFNLEFFSQRVVELGLYKPRYQPFVSKIKNEWIPGVLVDLGGGEQEQIHITDQTALQSLEEAIQIALTQKDAHVIWNEHQIPIDTARQIHLFAERQLTQKQSRPERSDAFVLIIQENLDELEFSDFLTSPNQSLLLETYSPPPWLTESYSLLAHQQAGLAWMQALYQGGYSGGLLADDMGLGKTLQTLSMLMWSFKDAKTPSQCLIIAPVSLLENWEQEYRRFFPDSPIPIFSAYGNVLNGIDGVRLSQELSRRTQIVLTTYETLRKKQLGFCAVNWEIIILDEAQRIKTPGTLTTNAAKALKARLKLAATGTPIENSLMDIWCILDFAAPGLLKSASEFRLRYRCNDDDADLMTTGQTLRSDIGFYMLRRNKREILDELPPKTLYQYEMPMPDIQLKAYLEALTSLQSFAGSGAYGSKVLETLHLMKLISEHPFLRNPEGLLEPVETLISSSAKLQATMEILLQIQTKNEKVVIFAEHRSTQHLLYRLLSERFGLNPGIVNGETPTTPKQGALSRQQTIDHFQQLNGFSAIIMSPIAAGVGLNVTAANHVIHYGRHWNPAKEDQATGRVYRFGQSKPVHVHIPMAVSSEFKTFDVLLHELLERKRSIAESSLVSQQTVSLTPVELFEALVNKSDTVNDLTSIYLEL